MSLVKIYGTSDDLVEMEGVFSAVDETGEIDHETGKPYNYDVGARDNTAEYNVYNDAVFVIGNQLKVFSLYKGEWAFGVGMVDEEEGLPNWPVHIRQSQDCDYSVELLIEVPDEFAHVVRVK